MREVTPANVLAAILTTFTVYLLLHGTWFEAEAPVPEPVECACECDGDALGVLHAWEQGWIVRDPTTGAPVVVR